MLVSASGVGGDLARGSSVLMIVPASGEPKNVRRASAPSSFSGSAAIIIPSIGASIAPAPTLESSSG